MKKTRKTAARNLIGPQIRNVRRKARPHISQEDLAGKLAAKGILVDRSAISRIENQERYLMDYEIVAIAKCLRVPIARLFADIK